MAVITNHYPDDREQNLGILEGGTGLGLLLGPLLGGALYNLGGYCLPFWTVGCICLLIFPLLKHTVELIKKEEGVKSAIT